MQTMPFFPYNFLSAEHIQYVVNNQCFPVNTDSEKKKKVSKLDRTGLGFIQRFKVEVIIETSHTDWVCFHGLPLSKPKSITLSCPTA